MRRKGHRPYIAPGQAQARKLLMPEKQQKATRTAWPSSSKKDNDLT
jgi:hypothetical protein